MKRSLDILVSCLALLLLLPVMAVTAALVRLLIGSPVIFRQERPGFRAQPFTLYKFRTMSNACGPEGAALPDDRRLSRFGRLLRSTSLDELPELMNVLKGDMSLVGPRPLLTEYLGRYSAEQARRHEVRPGITGWAQINGRNAITWEEKFRYDVWYVDNHTVLLDMKIIALTVWKVVTRQGISQKGHATAEKFTGTEKNDG